MSRRGWVLFGAMCVIWGVPYLMIRVAVREVTPATLVFARTGLGAVVLLPVAAWRKELRPVVRRWGGLLIFAAVEIAIPWLLLSRAETKLTSSLTGLLIAAVPLVGAVTQWATGGDEQLGPQRVAGLAVGIVGVAALVGLDLGGAALVPLVEIALVAVCYAVGPIILSRALADLPALGTIAASLAVSALAYAPVAAVQLPAHVPSSEVVWSIVGLAVVCTALSFVLFFALIAEVGPVRATVITYVNPAVAAAVGVAILGERFTAGMAIGFALILVGSVLATGRLRRDRVVDAVVDREVAVEP